MNGRGRNAICADLAVVALIFLLVFAIYGQTLGHGFVNFDDDKYVYENPRVLEGLRLDGVVWAFTTDHVHNWHPLTWISHMVDAQLFGAWPGGHHLTSVLLHACNGALLYWILRRATGRRGAAALAALLFAVHPQRVESVAWVSERKDVLSGLFCLITLAAYFAYAARRTALRYLVVALAFTVGLLSKQMLVTLPFALLLLDIWPLGRLTRDGWRRCVVEKIPLLGLTVLFSAVVFLVQSRTGVVKGLDAYPLSIRLGNAIVSYGAYLRDMVWPVDLAAFYPHPGHGLSWGVVAGVFALLAAVTTAALAFGRTRPYLAVGWLWYLGTLVPVIGLVQVGLQARADRYTYLPAIGVAVALAWLAADVVRGRPRLRIGAAVVAVALIGALSVQSHGQAATWRNNETLYARVIATQPPHPWPYLGLGASYFTRGDLDRAEEAFETALALDPAQLDAHYGLGIIAAEQSRHADAVAHFETVLAEAPRFLDARYQLGVSLLTLGRTDEAIAALERAVVQRPHDARAITALGVALASAGRLDEARQAFEEALRLDPNSEDARRNLSLIENSAG